MRRAAAAVAVTLLLLGPTVLAFYTGGYFVEPRLIAAIAAWLLVFAVSAVGPSPLPRGLPGRLALGGLVLVTAWSALSIGWAPLAGVATENVERLLLYVGVLLLAVGVLRAPRAMRLVEPALAAGATVVVGYGLAGRLAPGLVHLSHSQRAGGRLEQPITYWNAEGALAAVGFVLCARLAGDRSRPVAMRALAGAAAVPLATGVYLSYSRGAIAAGIVGLVVLVAATRSRAQLRAGTTVLVAGVLAALCSSPFRGVASLGGTLAARERDGAIVVALLVVVGVVTAGLIARQAGGQGRDVTREDRLPGARPLVAVTGVLVALVMAGLVVGGLNEKGESPKLQGGAERLTSASSNRYDYWDVGAREFLRHPVEGLGSGGFRVAWLRERDISENVIEVHSLELEMATELGLIGLLAFGLMVAGVALAARRALAAAPALAAGWCAALLVWFVHASIDWDWQLPAVSLPAIVLSGALIALAEVAAEGQLPMEEAAASVGHDGARAAGSRAPVPAR